MWVMQVGRPLGLFELSGIGTVFWSKSARSLSWVVPAGSNGPEIYKYVVSRDVARVHPFRHDLLKWRDRAAPQWMHCVSTSRFGSFNFTRSNTVLAA